MLSDLQLLLLCYFISVLISIKIIDWNDAEAELAIPGGKEHLWEENWDDDDADDDFSSQLKCVNPPFSLDE